MAEVFLISLSRTLQLRKTLLDITFLKMYLTKQMRHRAQSSYVICFRIM